MALGDMGNSLQAACLWVDGLPAEVSWLSWGLCHLGPGLPAGHRLDSQLLE